MDRSDSCGCLSGCRQCQRGYRWRSSYTGAETGVCPVSLLCVHASGPVQRIGICLAANLAGALVRDQR